MISITTILYSIIILSLIALIVVVFRKIPLLVNLSEEEVFILRRKKGVIQRLNEVNYKDYWLNLIVRLEKFLRKTKIIFLKVENILTKWIGGLRRISRGMSQKSREWIKQRELKRRKVEENSTAGKVGEILVKISEEEEEGETFPPSEEDEEIPISELKKPIKEEQKWINLIIENPQNITAYKFLGLLYWKQHSYSDAKASLEMSVKLGSRDRKVKEILEEIKRMGVK